MGDRLFAEVWSYGLPGGFGVIPVRWSVRSLRGDKEQQIAVRPEDSSCEGIRTVWRGGQAVSRACWWKKCC